MGEEYRRRKLLGRYKDRVALNVHIMSGQNHILEEYCGVFELRKTDAVIEAIQLWINTNNQYVEQARARKKE